MISLREKREQLEEQILSPQAMRSSRSKGRQDYEEECSVRTAFHRDRDRIIHSKAFRRLKHKTQVFISPEGDHYRTRLTHTLEVAQIARTAARALTLNEDLTEAIALGHDLGHTPFGHAGEAALSQIYGPFKHNQQSLRIVESLEGGKGLNLTWEVRDGILNHTGSTLPSTLEGQIVKIADRIAYINHDIDDALRAGILKEEDLPRDVPYILGNTSSMRINTMVRDLIENSFAQPLIQMSPQVMQVMLDLREFLFENVYVGSEAKKEDQKIIKMFNHVFNYFLERPEEIPLENGSLQGGSLLERRVCDYIAGMTDIYFINLYQKLFIPKPWSS
nr:deoxyguanosinetriphosphate triphosphohydrolase [Candidatus Contubernalis alkalaceticus]